MCGDRDCCERGKDQSHGAWLSAATVSPVSSSAVPEVPDVAASQNPAYAAFSGDEKHVHPVGSKLSQSPGALWVVFEVGGERDVDYLLWRQRHVQLEPNPANGARGREGCEACRLLAGFYRG
jgi:hypothetical protein